MTKVRDKFYLDPRNWGWTNPEDGRLSITLVKEGSYWELPEFIAWYQMLLELFEEFVGDAALIKGEITIHSDQPSPELRQCFASREVQFETCGIPICSPKEALKGMIPATWCGQEQQWQNYYWSLHIEFFHQHAAVTEEISIDFHRTRPEMLFFTIQQHTFCEFLINQLFTPNYQQGQHSDFAVILGNRICELLQEAAKSSTQDTDGHGIATIFNP